MVMMIMLTLRIGDEKEYGKTTTPTTDDNDGDGGLFAEDGSVLCRAGRYFGRTAGPIENRRRSWRLNAAHTAAFHRAGQDWGRRQGSQRKRGKEGEKERKREGGRERRAELAELSGSRGQTLDQHLDWDSTHHGGWASGLRFKNALINPIGFTGGSNTGRTSALDQHPPEVISGTP